MKDVTETVKNELKEQEGGFLGMMAAAFDAGLLRNALSATAIVRGSNGVIRAGEGVIRAGEEHDF